MYPEHDDMGEAKEHKLRLEIDQQNRDSAINRAMAEVAGWKQTGIWGNFWIAPNAKEFNETDGFVLPDYLTDLNAVHEIEKTFDNTQWWGFIGHLTELCGGASVLGVSATARQRCTAILKTLSKWNPEWDR